jgi:hypothetical protein
MCDYLAVPKPGFEDLYPKVESEVKLKLLAIEALNADAGLSCPATNASGLRGWIGKNLSILKPKLSAEDIEAVEALIKDNRMDGVLWPTWAMISAATCGIAASSDKEEALQSIFNLIASSAEPTQASCLCHILAGTADDGDVRTVRENPMLVTWAESQFPGAFPRGEDAAKHKTQRDPGRDYQAAARPLKAQDLEAAARRPITINVLEVLGGTPGKTMPILREGRPSYNSPSSTPRRDGWGSQPASQPGPSPPRPGPVNCDLGGNLKACLSKVAGRPIAGFAAIHQRGMRMVFGRVAVANPYAAAELDVAEALGDADALKDLGLFMGIETSTIYVDSTRFAGRYNLGGLFSEQQGSQLADAGLYVKRVTDNQLRTLHLPPGFGQVYRLQNESRDEPWTTAQQAWQALIDAIDTFIVPPDENVAPHSTPVTASTAATPSADETRSPPATRSTVAGPPPASAVSSPARGG